MTAIKPVPAGRAPAIGLAGWRHPEPGGHHGVLNRTGTASHVGSRSASGSVPPWRRLSLAVVFTVMLLVAGCETTKPERTPPAPAPSPSKPPPRLQASLVQQRIDEGTNHIDVRLTNRGRTPVQVRRVYISWSGITGSPPTSGTEYAAGRTVDLQTTYGRAACASEPPDDVEIVVTLGDGASLRLPVDRQGVAILRQLRDRDCNLEEIDAIADIALSPRFEPTEGGDRLHGSLIVRRTSRSRAGDRQELSVQGVFGSVLLAFTSDGGGGPPLVLEADADVLEVPVTLSSSNRCDAHALGQSSQTFLLSAYIRVDGNRTQRVIVVPDKAVQRQVTALLKRVCL